MGTPRYAYKLTLLIESVCEVLGWDPQHFLSLGPVDIENHRK